MSIPTSPGGLRSPRKRALEIGTSPSGFIEDAMQFHTQAGIPTSTPGAQGTYQSQGPFVGGGTGAIDTPVPFANLAKK